MKTTFTNEYILNNAGCYSQEQIKELIGDKPEFTIDEILDLNVSLKDKTWFIRKSCELTDLELKHFAIGCAEVVLPIYEIRYPENKAPREAIEAAKEYLAGNISIDVLREKRSAANAANAAAYAAAYATYAAGAAGAAYAANAANAANAAANAAYTGAAAVNYQDLLLQFFKDFLNKT